jgi:glucan phosphoethanolaminetransferase (alkaline phosphatase superfamily)
MGTGWVQFASRYSLDYQLFLILFLLLTFRNILHKPAFKIMLVVLLMISVFMNYYGAKMFYEISQP